MFWTDARKYVKYACKDAAVHKMDGYYIADIYGYRGVWIDAPTEKEALKELPSVLNEWLRKKISECYYDFPWTVPISLPNRWIYIPSNYTWVTKDSDIIRFPADDGSGQIPSDMLEYLLTHMKLTIDMLDFEVEED